MQGRKTGLRTPHRPFTILTINKSGPKRQRCADSVGGSRKASPMVSFRVTQNFGSAVNSVEKYSKPFASVGKKGRKSLQKQYDPSGKQSRPYRNFLSSTNTPGRNSMCNNESIAFLGSKKESLLKNYMFMYQIGFGGFGKVWKVQNRINLQYYAMKEMEISKVISKDSVECIINELSLLKRLSHPFIVNLISAFHDSKKLYMIIDYLKGADLRYHICYKEIFSEAQTKFLMACLIVGLEYLHEQNVIHRDIKPENLVLEQSGYVRFTDFGISKRLKDIKTQQKYDSSGTPGYMAPEMMEKLPYSFEVDFFALGVIAYELMFGERPYIGKNRLQIKEAMQKYEVKIERNQIPAGWCEDAADFINKLLVKDPRSRLGSVGGVKALKKHKWMASIDWRKLSRKELKPPFIPNIVCETKDYLEEIHCYNEMNDEKQNVSQNTLVSTSQSCLFEGYYFHPEAQEAPKKPKMKKARKFL